MNSRVRVTVFLVAAAGVAALFVWAAGGLPGFGHYPGPYGPKVVDAMNVHGATNAVTTVVMDVRAVDTAGEELILYAAAVGVIMLLRKQRGERFGAPYDHEPGRAVSEQSGALKTVNAALVAPLGLLGLYIVAHGQLTPGGGFQGGVILAGPSVLVFLAARYRSFERLHVPVRWEITQAVAVSGFLAFGFAGLIVDGAFLQNILPFGKSGTVWSAGTIPVLNVVAGPAVATAIVLIATELIQQVTEVRGR